jgi:DNA-binding NarL/FixJ family response regulator
MIKQKILIAEDHAILREGLRALLSGSPDLEIIGEAEDGQEAINLARQLQPHLVLMDLTMPNINGTEAIRTIKRQNPDICIIVLTVHKSEEYVRATLDAGANGYILKDDTHNDLLNAITSAQKGNIYLSPGICNKVINGYLDNASSTSLPSSSSWSQLTVREREVTKLIAEGKKSREVADYLSVSLKTVEKHRTNLMRKLDLHSVSAITKYAIENHLVDL